MVEDDALAIELLVEVDGRLEELLPEDKTTVWRVVALDMDGKRQGTAGSPAVRGLIQSQPVRATTYLQAVAATHHVAWAICCRCTGISQIVAAIASVCVF